MASNRSSSASSSSRDIASPSSKAALTRCLSSASTKSQSSSVSTACDSCNEDILAEEKGQQLSTADSSSMNNNNKKNKRSLVICNFNTSSVAHSVDKQQTARAKGCEEEEEEDEDEEDDGEDAGFDSDSDSYDTKKDHIYHFVKNLDLSNLQCKVISETKAKEHDIKDKDFYDRISDLYISSSILLSFEDKPEQLAEGVQGASCSTSHSTSKAPDCIPTLYFSRIKNQYEHILLQESYAVGLEPSNGHYFNAPFIIEKICSQSDLNELNKYIFLLDQFARLYLNDEGFERNRRNSPFYPFLFPQPLLNTEQEEAFLKPGSLYRKQINSLGHDPHTISRNIESCALSYTDRPFLETYLQLVGQLLQTTAGPSTESESGRSGERRARASLQLAHFCLKVFAQFPRLLRCDLLEGSGVMQRTLLQQMAAEHGFPLPPPYGLLEPELYEHLDNYGFVTYIRTHFHFLERGEVKLRGDMPASSFSSSFSSSLPSPFSQPVEHLIGTLYGRFNLPRLFRLYTSLTWAVRRVFCKAVFRRHPYARRLSPEARALVVERFYQYTFRNRKAPLLDVLHDLCPRVGGTKLSRQEEEAICQRAMVIFAYRCTLFRYARCISESSLGQEYVDREEAEAVVATAASLKATGIDQIEAFAECLVVEKGAHSYDRHPIRLLDDLPLCSAFVGHLYKLTIQLTLLLNVYSPTKGRLYLAELLKIQVEDFDFKTFLQQSLAIIESELNSINFDLLNRHEQQEEDLLFFDSDGMDSDFDLEPQNEHREQPDSPPFPLIPRNSTRSASYRRKQKQRRPYRQRTTSPNSDCSDSSSSHGSMSSLNSTVFNGPGQYSDDDDDKGVEDDNNDAEVNREVHACCSSSNSHSRPFSSPPPQLASPPQHHPESSTYDHNNNSSYTGDAYDGADDDQVIRGHSRRRHHRHHHNQHHHNSRRHAHRRDSQSSDGHRHHPHHHQHHHHHQHPQHRPPPPNTPVDIPLNLVEKRALLERLRNQGMTLLAPPNNRWSFEECAVCCEVQWLLVRSCCSFAACLDCLGRYYSSRIELGALSIECIGGDCHELVYRAEVNARLSPEQKALYSRLLLLSSSESERAKPCPQCNTILTLSAAKERQMKQANNRLLYGTKQLLGTLGLRRSSKHKKQKQQQQKTNLAGELVATGGEAPAVAAREASAPSSSPSSSSAFVYDSLVFKVECDRCNFFWCFKCHSPWHEGLSCKQFMKGDTLLKSWAKNVDYNGQVNAQKCPKCKIYIQRTSGCDHMLCTRCKTDFCYKCGDRLRQVKFFGDHYSRLSVLGCKYRYKPDKPFQRKLIRGTIFGSKLMLLPVLSTVCLCAGAVVLALGVAALPLFGGVRVYRRIRRAGGAAAAAAAVAATTNVGGEVAAERRRVAGRSNVLRGAAVAAAGHDGEVAVVGNNDHQALAMAAAASNEDVWNRTVQMYSARLRNRNAGEVIRIPTRYGNANRAANNNNNNNDNNNNSAANDAVDHVGVDPMAPQGHFPFSSWFNSSLMLHSPDEADPFFSHLPVDDAEFDSSDDDDEEEQKEAEGLGKNSRTSGPGYSFFPWHNVHQTSAMKLYNSSNRAGRNGVVLKMTEQDLNEIMDETPRSFYRRNHDHSHIHHSRNCHIHGHLVAGKSSKAATNMPKDKANVANEAEVSKPSSSKVNSCAATDTTAASPLPTTDTPTPTTD